MKNKLVVMLVLTTMLTSCFGGLVVAAQDDMVNVALYQTATASTVCGMTHNASHANDGINDNPDYSYWMSAPDDSHAWWQVDLGIPYEIDTLVLIPRIGADESERRNIRILAYAESTADAPEELVCVDSEGYGDSLKADISKKARYRYIRVEKTDLEKLSIGEFRVLIKKENIPQGSDFDNYCRQVPLENASNRYKIPNDVKGTPYENAVALLFALDIMHGYPDGSFLPYETISRAEFTSLAIGLIKDFEEIDKLRFSDVPFGYWAYFQIEYAAHKGIINGVGNGLFMPDDEVTLEQAVKIITSVMGYSDDAQKLGGYPAGYRKLAEEMGLLKDVDTRENITRGEIALLICNALECKLKSNADSLNDKNLLNELFGIEHSSAIVTEAGNISLISDSFSKTDGKITLGDKVYSTDIPDLESYIGRNVEYYYETKNPDKIIALTVSDTDKVISANVSQITDSKNNAVTYKDENGALETLEFDSDMHLVYNGKTIFEEDISTYLVPEAGTIKCIDNDKNGAIDLYMIYPERKYTGADYLEAFKNEMNKKALELGMNNSHFNDPVGMNNFSTPADLVKCLMEAYRCDAIREIWSKDNYSFDVEGKNERNVSIGFSLVTKGNNAVSSVYDVLGGKGGNLSNPLIYNMAAIVRVPDTSDSISAVIMGSTSSAEMYDALKQTIDAAIVKYKDKNADVSDIDVCSKSAIACVTSDNAKDETVVLFDKDSNLQDMTASTAKMLTAILVNQYVSDLDTKVYVTDEDISLLPSGFYVNDYKAGDILTVRDALHALLYKSSNSSAIFLGRMVGELIVKGR